VFVDSPRLQLKKLMKELPIIYKKENIDRLVRKEKLNNSGTELQCSSPPSQKIKEKTSNIQKMDAQENK
jgi:hypothetical protein